MMVDVQMSIIWETLKFVAIARGAAAGVEEWSTSRRVDEGILTYPSPLGRGEKPRYTCVYIRIDM